MTRSFARTSIALLACLLTTAARAADPALTDDGLVPIKVKNLDKAYKRPGASLKGYERILLRPVSVSFSKNWDPRDYGGTFGLKSEDVEKIRSSLSKLAGESFSRVLTNGGYPVVDSAGEHVLDVEAQIVDLYVNAPDIPTAEIKRTYVLSAGEMRLLVTLRDSVTGTILYRASDFQRDPETGRLEWANSVWNQHRADLALSSWALILKKALDAAKAQ